VVDLVCAVLDCKVGAALDWLVAAGYKIPILDGEARRRWRPTRAGVGGFGLDVVVGSGLLGLLPKPAGLLLCALCGLAEPDTGVVEISYGGLMRRAGIRNRNQVSQGIQLLRRLDLLSWRPAASPGGFRSPSVYSLSVDASTCHLAVEKLWKGAFHGQSSQTVKPDQNLTGDTQSLPPGSLGARLFGKKKNDEDFRGPASEERKAPNAQKSARKPEEKGTGAVPPTRRRRDRRIRHPGFERF
jgi:hypothetical protein